MKAHQLKSLDDQYMCYVQAWANRASKAMDKKGKKYQFKTIKDAFDFEKAEDEILGIKRHEKEDIDLDQIKAIAEYNREGG